jgi:ribosomal protein L29
VRKGLVAVADIISRIKDVRALASDDIKNRINELRRQWFDLRTQAVTEALKDPSQLGKTRKTIAKMMTVLAERDAATKAAAEADAAEKAAAAAKSAAEAAKAEVAKAKSAPGAAKGKGEDPQVRAAYKRAAARAEAASASARTAAAAAAEARRKADHYAKLAAVTKKA